MPSIFLKVAAVDLLAPGNSTPVMGRFCGRMLPAIIMSVGQVFP